MKDSVAINHQASSAPTVSVIVCTYNRSNLLAGTLQTLCRQTIDPSEYEVIVVDNNSSDNTRALTEEFCRRCGNVHYHFEPRQGLSHARNRGWEVAKGGYVAYVDDDCEVPTQWLAIAMEIVEKTSPGVFGGPYFPFYNSAKPHWFKDAYGSHEQGNKARLLGENEFLDGANVFFRRNLLETLGGFDTRLGMSGNKTAYGEETALLKRIRASMPDQSTYYDPRLYLYHLVPRRKMSLAWIVSQRFIDGRYSYRVFQGKEPPAVRRCKILTQAVRTLLAFCVDLARGIIKRDREQHPYFQNYLYEHAFRYLATLGKLYEQYQRIVRSPADRTASLNVS